MARFMSGWCTGWWPALVVIVLAGRGAVAQDPSPPWSGAAGLEGSLWHGAEGTAVVWIEHPGGHEVPPGAVESIIRFFRESIPASRSVPTDAAPPRATPATD